MGLTNPETRSDKLEAYPPFLPGMIPSVFNP
jgi:hypothetical protein